MKVSIERKDCISCGICVSLCPEVFQFADDGLSEVRQQPGPGEEAAARDAAEACPVSIIYVED